jgi:hypothetical protein
LLRISLYGLKGVHAVIIDVFLLTKNVVFMNSASSWTMKNGGRPEKPESRIPACPRILFRIFDTPMKQTDREREERERERQRERERDRRRLEENSGRRCQASSTRQEQTEHRSEYGIASCRSQ